MPQIRKYAGIGSRQTPAAILELMREIGKQHAAAGWLLRSGGADGADKAFEEGCRSANGKMEKFLPWPRFNNSFSDLYTVGPDALKLASQVHPAWQNLSSAAKVLHARNCYQILGSSLDDPVECVICWTPAGAVVGGTATAIKIAERYKIPVYNLGKEKTLAANIKQYSAKPTIKYVNDEQILKEFDDT